MSDARADDDDAPRAGHFDSALDAWVLSRYADVSSALREPSLVMPGSAPSHVQSDENVRDVISRSWGPERISWWRATIERDAATRVAALPAGEPVDLVTAFAVPWCVELALLVTGASRANASESVGLARQLFLASAEATNGSPHESAQDAAMALSQRLAAKGAPGEVAMHVQAFVALTQTLPALLASSWRIVAGDTVLQLTLRDEASGSGRLSTRTINELLRVSGPARAVFREAIADVSIGDTELRAGHRVVLRLSAANVDPARFQKPSRVNCAREASGHVAFGAGAHACAGASLVRMALDVATGALLRGTTSIELESTLPPGQVGGFAISAPATVFAVLERSGT